MSIINHVFLVGRLTSSAQANYSASGCAIVSFSVAVSDKIRAKDGSEGFEEYTSFFDCVGFGNYFNACLQSLTKGAKVTIHGKLKQDRWQKDGENRQRVQIIVDEIDIQNKQPKTGGSAADRQAEPVPEEVSNVANAFGGTPQPEIF